ncbi:MAG: LytTR family transcriptional regulator [Saprospiraceae bacterium]|nr:LytTR family transcriptional regulator [Saprospiraceae bacterium]
MEQNIIFLEAQSNYTLIYYHSGKRRIVTHTLKKVLQDYEDQFLRIHHSFAVNSKCIRQISIKKKCLITSDGRELPISRRKLPLVFKNLALAL